MKRKYPGEGNVLVMLAVLTVGAFTSVGSSAVEVVGVHGEVRTGFCQRVKVKPRSFVSGPDPKVRGQRLPGLHLAGSW